MNEIPDNVTRIVIGQNLFNLPLMLFVLVVGITLAVKRRERAPALLAAAGAVLGAQPLMIFATSDLALTVQSWLGPLGWLLIASALLCTRRIDRSALAD